MPSIVPRRTLPPNPSLEQLRKKAKDFRDLVRTGHPKGLEIVRILHPDPPPASDFRLADAQLVIAREYGFASWRRLREHLVLLARYTRSPQRPGANAGDATDEFLRLACLTYRPSWKALAGEEPDGPHRHRAARELLARHPHLARENIYTAAAAADPSAMRAFLAADATNANLEGGPHGWPPLLYLTLSRLDTGDPLATARLLLEHGADANAGYLPDGEPPPVTALSAVLRGSQDPANQPAHPRSMSLARLLLEHGADPNDERAVDNACNYPHEDDALKLLLRFGAGRESGSGGPWRARLGRRIATPAELVRYQLRHAAEWDLPDRIRLLVNLADQPSIDSALSAATVCGNTGVERLLLAAGASRGEASPAERIIAACMRADGPDVAEVERLRAAEPDLDFSGPWPDPMLQAAALNRPEAIKMLVALGFPLDDRRGTPLHVAALTGHLELAKMLVEMGADPHAEADDDTPGQFTPPGDRSPLSWARYLDRHDVAAYLESLS